MTTLKEEYLEWALKHLQKYAYSDFHPKVFEFKAISHNWQEFKRYLLSIDLEQYTPKSPSIFLAPKSNGNFRITHVLDPFDSLIYTALVKEVCEGIEEYRIPVSENIVFSNRIAPDEEGSFFSSNTGWDNFISKTEELTNEFKDGYVIVADITDFYNQIYTHRINNLLVEAGKGKFKAQAQIIEDFLLTLNKKTSRGIPVGPVPSKILAELIMGDIDNKILKYTNKFVRWVDDIRIFFKKAEDATFALHGLTYYMYSNHRLVLSGEKTEIISVKKFREKYTEDEEKQERDTLAAKANELAYGKMQELVDNLPEYSEDFNYEEEYQNTLDKILSDNQLELLSSTYFDLFKKALVMPRDYGLMRHLLRQSARYRIRNIVPLVLDYFYGIRPITRESILYLNTVLNEKTVIRYKSKFEALFSHHLLKLPYINLWVSYLLQNVSFNATGLPSNYDNILTIRQQALIALRKKDRTWVRALRDDIDKMGHWDKRAVLYATSILPYDEMLPLARTIASGGDIIDKSIFSLICSKKKPK